MRVLVRLFHLSVIKIINIDDNDCVVSKYKASTIVTTG